jgi:hypothetical protein
MLFCILATPKAQLWYSSICSIWRLGHSKNRHNGRLLYPVDCATVQSPHHSPLSTSPYLLEVCDSPFRIISSTTSNPVIFLIVRSNILIGKLKQSSPTTPHHPSKQSSADFPSTNPAPLPSPTSPPAYPHPQTPLDTAPSPPPLSPANKSSLPGTVGSPHFGF